MKHILRYLTILVLMACLPSLTLAADPEIAYGSGALGELWVMDQDGANKTLVCEGRVSYPHWSRDGNSVVFVYDSVNVAHLYRIDMSGSPSGCSDTILANQWGTFSVTENNTPQYLIDLLNGEDYGAPDIYSIYEGLGPPAHWSPVADEVAVLVRWRLSGNRDVIAVADPSGWNDTLVPIYASAEGVGIGDFAWSPDGSELAVVEGPIDDADPYIVLKIIDRSDGLAVDSLLWYAADLGLPEPDSPIVTLDWARTDPGGYLMAYMTFVPGFPAHKGEWRVMVTDFGAESPIADEIMEGRSPSWSPDDTQLVLSTAALNPPQDKERVIAKVNMASREGTILGGSGNSDWKRGPTSSVCTTAADCDDGNPCTDDDCVASACTYFPNSFGCDDGNECTVNDICLNGTCIGTGLEEGAHCSSGLCCTGWCQDVCSDHAECDDNDTETTDTCLNPGTCAATCENVGECVQLGEVCTSDSDCCSGRCHPVKGVCK